MKKLFLVMAFALAIVATGFAQKANVNKAKNKAFPVEGTPDFQGAKVDIEAALENEETKNLANTWFVAATIYEAAAKVESDLILAGEDALKAYECYLKANELDQLPDAKGKVKPKFTKKIATGVSNIYRYYLLVNYGVEKQKTQEWSKAYNALNTHVLIPDLPFMLVNELPIINKDTAYYEIKYFAAQFAWANEDSEKAISILEEIKDKDYNNNAVYMLLCQYYLDSKDTLNYVSTLEKGLAKFPNEFYYLGNLINHYVFGGQPQKATELLDKAISNDPNNAQLYSVRGSMLEVLEDIDGAMANFDKAIELKPDFKDAWLGKARLIYNKAFKMEQKALEIRDFKLSDQEVAKALEVYKESIPFFEKVIELDSEDFETMKTLRGLFYKLTNSDPSYQAKYDEINKKMLGY